MTPTEFANHAAEIAALKATVRAQSREIRDLKVAARDLAQNNAAKIEDLATKIEEMNGQLQPFVLSAQKIDKILTEADRQDGMRSLAKTLIGGGFLAGIGAAIVGIFKYFAGVSG
jgi:hypothetical protein